MKNIHLLPTEKPSRLFKFANELHLDTIPKDYYKKYNIYITSDLEIKDVRPHKGKWQLEKGQILNKFPDYLTDLSECKLVILTTDQDLIADGVQSIDDEFLEWFVKNPSCDKVEVSLEENMWKCCHYFKEDKEEYDKNGIPRCPKCDTALGGNPDNVYYKIIIPQEESKQETLEEAAERNCESITHPYCEREKSMFIKGAKWQSERMYSEEEVEKIISKLMDEVHSGDICYGDKIIDFKISPKKWFEKNKK
jgi:hypothetical protein